jgi:NAD dependent epimerase/dehydratase family enzyme
VKVVIAGGSDSRGRRISADLSARGHQVVVLARRPDASSAVRQVLWDGRTVGDWATELAGQDTAANVAELRHSRVAPTSALVQASQQLEQPVRHWVQASTTAI